MADKQTYPVLSPLRHNKVRYAPDTGKAQVELTRKEAEALLKLKVIGAPEPVKTVQETAPKPAEGTADDRTQAILDAIAKLGPDQFNKDGSPKVAAVERLTGFDVSADEVKVLHQATPVKA
ncbi:hypothetical protein [Flexibacterium corallicola]|uniref:hypothetical protein n=1 Tax=Flexibacterium corallicola TaxID=3037259 RepID=UPI00286ECE78|nr:hypothetical protein [Pseudovibrio sp. M1P-2-3]